MLGLMVGALVARLLFWPIFALIAVLRFLLWLVVVTGMVLFIIICLLSERLSKKVRNAKTGR